MCTLCGCQPYYHQLRRNGPIPRQEKKKGHSKTFVLGNETDFVQPYSEALVQGAWKWVHGNVYMGMGAWEWVHGNVYMGMGAWEWVHGNVYMGMGTWE